MIDHTGDLTEWETQRQRFLAALITLLEAESVDLDADPTALVPTIDEFVAAQDYSEIDQDDWLWLHTALAAYVAEVLIRKYDARWERRTDGRGPNYLLVAEIGDGTDHAVSPMDVVHDGLQQTPPAITRMIATAELAAGLVPDNE